MDSVGEGPSKDSHNNPNKRVFIRPEDLSPDQRQLLEKMRNNALSTSNSSNLLDRPQAISANNQEPPATNTTSVVRETHITEPAIFIPSEQIPQALKEARAVALMKKYNIKFDDLLERNKARGYGLNASEILDQVKLWDKASQEPGNVVDGLILTLFVDDEDYNKFYYSDNSSEKTTTNVMTPTVKGENSIRKFIHRIISRFRR